MKMVNDHDNDYLWVEQEVCIHPNCSDLPSPSLPLNNDFDNCHDDDDNYHDQDKDNFLI